MCNITVAHRTTRPQPSDLRASIDVVRTERRLPTRTPESRAFAERVPVVMALTARLNTLPFDDLDGRRALLDDVFGHAVPESLTLLPPFFTDHGLRTSFGERVFVNQNCSFSDLGGIHLGDRVLVGPNVTLATSGHPVHPDERFDALTHAPIVLEADVWVGAAATICPGVTIGRGSVVGAGTVVAQDVPPMSVVTGTAHVERRRMSRPPDRAG